MRVAVVGRGPRLNQVFEELDLRYVERPVPANVRCSPSGKVATLKTETVKASSTKGVAGTAKAEAKKRKGSSKQSLAYISSYCSNLYVFTPIN